MLIEDINEYKDKYGYVNPFKANKTQGRQCDNVIMYTCEYIIMVQKNNEHPEHIDPIAGWVDLMSYSFQRPGLLMRYPVEGLKKPDTADQDGPDNVLGLLAASKVLKIPKFAKQVLDYGRSTWGWFNNEKPGTWRKADGKTINWSAFLWRQPQLLFASLCAANEVKWYHWPLALYSALTIYFAGMGADRVTDTDSRRLSWLLIQTTQEDSYMCRLAANYWRNRLYKDYGPGLMKEVAKIYYQPPGQHPFCKYFVT